MLESLMQASSTAQGQKAKRRGISFAAFSSCGHPGGRDGSSARRKIIPTRPITVVVPFPAGGPSDVVARIVTEQMARTLGQIDGDRECRRRRRHVGSARVAAAAPDGYTLLAGSMGSHVAAPVLTPNVKYDPSRDFEPIGFTAHAPAVIVAAQGFSGQGPERIRGLSEAERRQGEAGAWRHRRLLAHGVPAVRLRGRHEADARWPIAAPVRR